MADLDLLRSFSAEDEHWNGTRRVSIHVVDDQAILTVTHRNNDGDYTTQNYRLTEVQQRWVEVDA